MSPDGRWFTRGKSGQHMSGVPGESRGGGQAPNSPGPTVTWAWARGSPRESNRDDTGEATHRGEKGNPPRCNLRIGRTRVRALSVARRDRKSRAAAKVTTRPVAQATERDDHQRGIRRRQCLHPRRVNRTRLMSDMPLRIVVPIVQWQNTGLWFRL